MNPFELNALPEPVGYGTTGMIQPESTDQSAADVFRTAWDAGIRYFDTAPMYGSGLAEVRIGRMLAGVPRNDYVLSSKVGRLVEGASAPNAAGTDWVFDFSADGIKRSVEASLNRLGLDRIDILFIHDPDNHWETAITEAWPVLEDLRSQGVVRAVGAGMTRVPLLTRFARETSMDIFLLAGRYTLLATEGMDELLHLCQEKRISVVVAQSLHGGLIEGVPNPQLHYQPIDEETCARVARMAEICHAHGVSTAAAAIQFPLAHPAVTGLLTGPATGEQLRSNLGWLRTTIPAEVWTEFKAAGVLREDAPVPA
ncbi:MAG: aldo/keto reductase [Thermomicrobiales bacterium]